MFKVKAALQELALKLRAEGKTYKPQKAKNSSTKAEVGPEPFKVAVSSQQHHKQPSSQQHQQQQQQQQATPAREETGTRPDGDVQVHTILLLHANSRQTCTGHLDTICIPSSPYTSNPWHFLNMQPH